MMSMQMFHWAEISASGACAPGEARFRGARTYPLHTHDFPELFWVESGRGKHQINKRVMPLRRGTLVFIRPGHIHGFVSDPPGMVIRNVAFAPSIVAEIRERFFCFDDSFWNWSERDVPVHQQLDHAALNAAGSGFESLRFSDCGEFSATRFLLHVLGLIHPAHQSDGAEGIVPHGPLPRWLRDAMIRFASDPNQYALGTRGLVELASRSPEHVARTLQAATGVTPTQWVTSLRLRKASVLLQTTDRKILDIALDCGFESVSHFHSIFRLHHRCTPRQYRTRFFPRPI